jgi:hypothetical protein
MTETAEPLIGFDHMEECCRVVFYDYIKKNDEQPIDFVCHTCLRFWVRKWVSYAQGSKEPFDLSKVGKNAKGNDKER